MPNQRDVEFTIRASDLGSKTFVDVAKSVDQVTAALDNQVKAAKAGDVSASDLRATLAQLKTAGDALIKQQGVVDYYVKLQAELSQTGAKADALRAQFSELNNSGGIDGLTKKEVASLTALQKSMDAVERKAQTQSAALAVQAQKMGVVGIAADEVGAAQEVIVASAQKVGSAIGLVNEALTGYNVNLKATKAAQAALAEQNAFEQELADAQKLRQAAEYVDFWTTSLVAAEAKEKELSEVAGLQAKAAEARQLQQAAEYVNFWTESLNRAEATEKQLAETTAFNKIGVDAQTAAANLGVYSGAATKSSTATSSLAKSLLEILNPSAAAVQTLDGLEARIGTLAAEIGDAKKPIGTYTEAINGLSQAQSALLNQAKGVDQFKNQQAAVNDASAALDAAKAKVMQYGQAVATAVEPDLALAASLKQAQSAMAAANTQFDNEKAKLDALAASMVRAGVDTDNLAAAEKRLTAASAVAAAAQGKIGKNASGANSAAGSFLGLKPYELQNLSYQINDVFTQIASGTSIMQTAAQQGGQIAQIFPEAIGAIVAFLPEIVVVGAAIATFALAWKRVTDLDTDTRKFAAGLQLSADGAKYNAAALATNAQALTDLGEKSADAKKAIDDFTQQGLDASKINTYTKAALQLSKVTGQDLPSAAATLSTSFKLGWAAVQDLDSHLNFLTVDQAKSIKAMFDSGDAAKAQSTAFQILQDKLDGAYQKQAGPWLAATQALTHAWHNFLDAIGDTGLIQGTIAELERLADLAERFGPKGGGTSGLAAGAVATPGGSGIGLPGGVQMQKPVGLLGVAGAGMVGGLPGMISAAVTAATANAQVILTPEIIDIVRTTIAEAGRGQPAGQQAVASTILNRMARSGQTGSQVVRSPSQFQPWMTAQGRSDMAAIATDSKAFQATLENILPLLQGKQASTVGNSTTFYSPKGQAANVRNGLSKDLVPKWAQGLTPNADVGGQLFFPGAFPGQTNGGAGGSTANTATQQAQKIGQQMLQTLTEQIDATNHLNDAETVRLAGLKTERDFQNAGADAQTTAAAKAASEADAQRKVDVERLAQQKSALQQFTSLQAQAATGQDQSLSERLDVITNRFKALGDTIDGLQKQGLQNVNGQTLDQLRAQAAAYEDIQKQQATVKFYEDQLAALTKTRADALNAIKAKVDAGGMSAGDAVAASADVQAKLLPQITAVSQKAIDFATALNAAHPDPKLVAFIQTMQTAPLSAVSGAAKTQLGYYEDAANALVKQEQDQLKAIADLGAQGTLTSDDVFKQSADVVAKLGPDIATLAGKAADFAKSLAPSPATQAFIAQMSQLAGAQGNPKSLAGPLKPVADQQISAQDAKLNSVLQDRTSIVTMINTEESQGDITHQQAQDKLAATYAEFSPLIKAQSAALLQLVTDLHSAGVISDQTFEAWQAKIDTINTQTKSVSANFTELRQTITQSFTSGAVSAFDTVTTSIGAAIVGTGKWGDVLTSVGQAALQFGANFLKSIGDALTQMLALKAIQSMPGLNSLTGGLLNATGLTAGAGALGAAGATVTAGGAAVSAGAAALGISAAALGVSATALAAASGVSAAASAAKVPLDLIGLLHEGGTVGSVGGMSRPDFAGAYARSPRYHGGIAGVGLSSNEQRAILKKGEEVLSDDSPRNMKNWGKGGGSQTGASGQGLRVVAAFDPKDIHALMASPAGEQIVLAHIKKNAPAVRQYVGASSGSGRGGR